MAFQHSPDPPWIFRTYAGHSTPAESNKLYRANLARGQTGLSVAFDLPTQTGYDSDHELARGEVGKVGVPVGHLGDMRALFDGIPLERMNTSMTINAPAAWLLALYVALAQEQGAAYRHDAERHPQRISLARHLHLPARAELEAHRRHHRLEPRRDSKMESDQRLLLPFAGSRRDARARIGVRVGGGDCCAG
jgi:methylmalonyl-CoA mutase N-terminal domain/subunit